MECQETKTVAVHVLDQPDHHPDQYKRKLEIAQRIARFFNGLEIDLQGVQLDFQRFSISGAPSKTGAQEGQDLATKANNVPSSSLPVLELELGVAVRALPPLNVQF